MWSFTRDWTWCNSETGLLRLAFMDATTPRVGRFFLCVFVAIRIVVQALHPVWTGKNRGFPMAAMAALWRQAMLRLDHRLSMLRMPMLAPIGPPILAAPSNASQVSESEQSLERSMPSATEIFGHWYYNLRPREFSVRLDVKMKRAAAPYPRNPNRKKPVPKVKGIIRKLMKWYSPKNQKKDTGCCWQVYR